MRSDWFRLPALLVLVFLSRSESTQVQESVVKLEESLLEQRSLNDGLQGQLESRNAAMGELQGTIEVQSLNLQQVEQDLAKKQEEIIAKEKEVAQGKAELAKVLKDLDEAKKRSRDVEKSKQDVDQDRARLKGDLQELKKQIKDYKHQARDIRYRRVVV